jgi:hypothetical protein
MKCNNLPPDRNRHPMLVMVLRRKLVPTCDGNLKSTSRATVDAGEWSILIGQENPLKNERVVELEIARVAVMYQLIILSGDYCVDISPAKGCTMISAHQSIWWVHQTGRIFSRDSDPSGHTDI